MAIAAVGITATIHVDIVLISLQEGFFDIFPSFSNSQLVFFNSQTGIQFKPYIRVIVYLTSQ